MINSVILVGRLTKDPELRVTKGDISVTRFTLAVNKTFGDKGAEFIPCVVWRKQAEMVDKYLSKGRLVAVEGRLETKEYEKDGIKRYMTEVICNSVQFLDSKEK